MKKTIIPLIVLLSLCGCTTVAKKVNELKEVQTAINNLLPSDFKGDVDTGRSDEYFNITLKAGNLHKNDKGEWTWDWVDYSRETHIGVIGPAGWHSSVHVKLGTPKPST